MNGLVGGVLWYPTHAPEKGAWMGHVMSRGWGTAWIDSFGVILGFFDVLQVRSNDFKRNFGLV
ncbi:MAG: hypothetical protein ACLQLH_04835 [Terracidiphilus sp.]